MGIFTRRRKRISEAAARAIETYELSVQATDAVYPHCDSLILHSPGSCEFCDRHPEWQSLRIDQGIAFSNDPEDAVNSFDLIPCPSTIRRSAEVRDLWYGNVPKPAKNNK